jgi:steroid delta-isomerase-like uncharacterized protein
MNQEDQIKIIDDFIRAMNQHDVEKMGQFCTGSIVADEVAEPEPFIGIEAFKQAYMDVFQGYPDCVAEIFETFVDGVTVICQVRWKGTNSGIFRGAKPTGKKVDIRIAYFFTLKDKKIDRITEYYDLASILMQQGQLEL